MADEASNEEESKRNVPSQEFKSDKQSKLGDFVADEYRQQKIDGKMEPTEEIDEERCANFFSRAMKESHRMNSEVQKSYQKMENLHKELGPDIFNEWRAEHTSEVLTTQEREAVERAHQQIHS